MEMWEHKFVIFEPRSVFVEGGYEAEVNSALERYGREGWQLVSHAPHQTNSSGSVKSLTFTFKRPR
ncbi:DUF4177 domain-containing protein [Streptomyces sp. NPDC050617]|uniref:DUF4177 domain-containing protein n=1 Tax=Streptomyces sp. NPDC050617 TaxID=3154628 RepID=UPI0034216726